MTIFFKFKHILLVLALTCTQPVFAQSTPSNETQQSSLTNAVQEVKPAKKVSVRVEWTVPVDLGISKTEIIADQSVVCELKRDFRICDLSLEPGVREITINDKLSFGTYSEKFNLEIGKRYKIEVVLDQTNTLVDSLFFDLPVTAVFRQKGKNASVKLKLVSVSDEPLLSAELTTLLSAELAKLKAQQNNSQQIVTNQNTPTTNKFEPPKPLPIFANRKALVIGNDGYKFVSKLLNAKEDANAIAENLTKVGYKVTLKLDQSEKEMKASLRNFKAQVEAGDEVAFFYAGHGVQLANTNYLLPVDVAGEGEEQIKDEAISLQRILDDMSDKKVKFTLAMIDACRDNPFKSSGRSIGGGARGLAPTTAATGQMVVFSAGTGQQALDKLGPNDKDKNGLFTRLFIKEMQKTGITIDQLVRSVRNEVVTTAKSIGHDQVPAIYDQVVGEFYFRK